MQGPQMVKRKAGSTRQVGGASGHAVVFNHVPHQNDWSLCPPTGGKKEGPAIYSPTMSPPLLHLAFPPVTNPYTDPAHSLPPGAKRSWMSPCKSGLGDKGLPKALSPKA